MRPLERPYLLMAVGFATMAVAALGGCSAGFEAQVAAQVAPVAAGTADHAAAGLQAEFEQVTPMARCAEMTVSFHNRGARDVRVTAYRVRWSAGSLDVPTDMVVPAGTSAVADLQVGPEAGDLDALYARPMGVRVEIVAAKTL